MVNLAQPLGYRDELISKRNAILANVSPAHRWRILGVRRRSFLPPVAHVITVDCSKPLERKVEAIVVKRPVAVKVNPFIPLAVTPETPRLCRQILRAVAEAWGITVYDLCSPRRLRKFAWPRFAAMALLYSLPNWSTVMVGKQLGGRDHTTILSGVTRAKELRASDLNWRHRYEAAHIALAGGIC